MPSSITRRSLLASVLLVAACSAPVVHYDRPATGPANAFAKGDRLRFQEYDVYSGVRTSERIVMITRLDDPGAEIDDGRIRLGRDGSAPTDVTPTEHTVTSIEDRTVGGLQMSVARIQVRGMSERPPNPVSGAWGAERFTGELFVDRKTGIVVEGKFRTANRALAFHRRLVQVIR